MTTTTTTTTTETLTTRQAIRALLREALAAGDSEQARYCGLALAHRLLDSETGELIELEDVGSAVAYTALVVASLEASEAEGHVAFGGRRVYAE